MWIYNFCRFQITFFETVTHVKTVKFHFLCVWQPFWGIYFICTVQALLSKRLFGVAKSWWEQAFFLHNNKSSFNCEIKFWCSENTIPQRLRRPQFNWREHLFKRVLEGFLTSNSTNTAMKVKKVLFETRFTKSRMSFSQNFLPKPSKNFEKVKETSLKLTNKRWWML